MFVWPPASREGVEREFTLSVVLALSLQEKVRKKAKDNVEVVLERQGSLKRQIPANGRASRPRDNIEQGRLPESGNGRRIGLC